MTACRDLGRGTGSRAAGGSQPNGGPRSTGGTRPALSPESAPRAGRGMSTLLSLVTAITVLTVVLSGTVIVVEDAFRGTQRGDAERAVAIGASDRLVAADGPIADRANVVNATALGTLDGGALRELGASDRFEVAVALDGERVATAGEPDGGTVVRRIVLVETTERVERTPSLDGPDEATLPVRTDELELSIEPPSDVTVTAVRANGHVVLANAAGLSGTHTVETARYETVRLAVEATESLSTGDVTVAYRATDRERARLAVTVRDRAGASNRGESV